MSQEKVDKYKEEKKNRRKIMRHEKIVKRLEITAVIVIVAGLIGWFSVTVFRQVKSDAAANQKVSTTRIDNTAVDNYINDLSKSTGESS